ncbi:S24 family peptidase [Streptococcus sp. X13SY08]|uniref:S24 family peptidase n=1 Tax=Streptococcus sp. X13SY08 TaxID=1676616 RepID=UPI003FA7B10E
MLDDIRLSAGRGQALGNEFESRTVYSDKLYDYDVATWIRGDSMSPHYESGEVALIRETGYDYEGAVYAVVWNDETYIKKVFREKNGIRLVSINKEYKDMFAPFSDEPKVVGRVIGHFFPMEA